LEDFMLVRTLKLALPGLAAAALASVAQAAPADPAMGVWFTADKSAKVGVEMCGATVCGRVRWLKAPLDKAGKPVVDANNPEPGLRSRPVIGLVLIRDFKAAGPGKWTGGKIYDPKTGRTYDASLEANGGDTLKVRGCMGPLCQTQTWVRSN